MDILYPILYTILDYPILSYLLVFAIFFLESLVFIGMIVPGTIFLMAVGFLVYLGIFPLNILLVVFSAIFIGDFGSYYLGGHGKNFFKEGNRIFKMKFLLKGEEYFEQHKNKSILFGRFIGFFRPLIPFIAGLFKMERRRFLILNSASIAIWMAVYFCLGYFFGQALTTIEAWSKRLSHYMLLFAGLIILVYLGKKLFNNFRKNG